MNPRIFLSLAAVGCLVLPAASNLRSGEDGGQPGQKIPKFTATTTTLLDSHANGVVTCYVFVGTKCGTTPAYEERFRELEGAFRSKGVDFVYVYPNKTESHDEKVAWHKKVGLKGSLLEDEGAKITQSLGIKQTAQAVVCDKDGKVLFRGGIDDNRDASAVEHAWVAEALDEHLAGKPVTTNNAKAFG